VLLCAAPARAGVFLTGPISTTVCGDANVAGNEMPAPTGVYGGLSSARDCAKDCKIAAKECQQFVKSVIACKLSTLPTYVSFSNQNCVLADPNSAPLKVCKQGVADAAKLFKAGYKDDRDTGLQGCESWSQTCQASCVQ
jgi:hypothetical protein